MRSNNQLPATTNLDRIHSTKSLILMIQSLVVSASLYILLLGTSRKSTTSVSATFKNAVSSEILANN